jgi:hypothetical protein
MSRCIAWTSRVITVTTKKEGAVAQEALRLTYIAWQGWCVESPRACLLIDPLLVDEVGRGPKAARVDFMFRTRREFDFPALGAVDAVFLSHEHEDHFNIPTLARLDRKIPLLVSGLMSDAGRTLLKEMGFTPDYVWSGDTRAIGDLEIEFFGPNHVGIAETDEWDTTAYIVRHRSGLGSFGSNVDIPISSNLRNALDAERSRGMEPVVFSGMMVAPWRESGFPVDVAAENQHRPTKAPSFNSNTDMATFTDGNSFAPFPGEVLVMAEGTVRLIDRRAPFLKCLDGLQSVRPFANRDGELQDPVTEVKNFDVSRRVDLETELQAFAEYLYGGSLFRLLLSIGNEARGDRRKFVIAFVVDEQGTEWVYEYRPESCAFVPVDRTSEQLEEYLAALLMWATDFLAVAHGEVEPRVLERSLAEERADDRIPKLSWFLWRFYHPLRFPKRVLAQYRKALLLEEHAPICVRPRTPASSTDSPKDH